MPIQHKYVVFDLDGTLVQCVDTKTLKALQALFPSLEKFSYQYNQSQQEGFIFPGAPSLLEYCKAAGFKIAFFSCAAIEVVRQKVKALLSKTSIDISEVIVKDFNDHLSPSDEKKIFASKLYGWSSNYLKDLTKVDPNIDLKNSMLVDDHTHHCVSKQEGNLLKVTGHFNVQYYPALHNKFLQDLYEKKDKVSLSLNQLYYVANIINSANKNTEKNGSVLVDELIKIQFKKIPSQGNSTLSNNILEYNGEYYQPQHEAIAEEHQALFDIGLNLLTPFNSNLKILTVPSPSGALDCTDSPSFAALPFTPAYHNQTPSIDCDSSLEEKEEKEEKPKHKVFQKI